jgi:hypothetical protein
LIFSIDKGWSFVFGGNRFVGQKNRFLWAGLFAKAAEDASELVDFISHGIFFFAVKVLLPGFSLSGYHGDGLCGTGNCAEAAGRASFAALLVAFQNMFSPINI